MKEEPVPRYSKNEEFLNILTHGIGLLLSATGLPLLILKSLNFSGFWKPASLYIFGISLITLYAASTFYHAAKNERTRKRLNIFDHAAIFLLIAGTYTPFTLITLEGQTGWILFTLTWIFALAGIILKFFFTGKYNNISTLLYILMGWQIVFVIKPLMSNFPAEGLQLLIIGGVFYTIGAMFYSIKKLLFNHAIFHVFVILGSLSHFFSILIYMY